MWLEQALEQFETVPLWALKWQFFLVDSASFIIITNFNLTLVFATLSVWFFFICGLSKKIFFISNYELLAEKIYRFILNIVLNQTGKHGEKYFAVIFAVFLFILFSNIIGLIPGNFCITSQLLVTLTLSVGVFVGLTIIAISIQGINFVFFFVPKNVPSVLLPFLIFIEIVSYISRVFSLALRLFANMVAGHALLHILSGATVAGLKKIGSFSIFILTIMAIPLVLLCAIICLEIGIAFLQAYVFVVLFSIYLNDCFGHGH
jgi:F-type H+-transporting ATPase subunit a